MPRLKQRLNALEHARGALRHDARRQNLTLLSDDDQAFLEAMAIKTQSGAKMFVLTPDEIEQLARIYETTTPDARALSGGSSDNALTAW